jgi:AraC-like DNA-binding protein
LFYRKRKNVTSEGSFVTVNSFTKEGDTIERIFRPSRKPLGVPFGLRSVGHVKLEPAQWRGSRDVKIDFAMIYWIVSGFGFIVVDNKEYPLRKNDIACYNVGGPTKILTKQGSMEYRFLTFDGTAASLITNSFQLDGEPFNTDYCHESCFKNLHERLKLLGPLAEKRTSAELYKLLTEIAINKKTSIQEITDNSFMEKALPILNKKAFSVETGVSQIAEELGYDRSSFTRKLKAETGVSPKEYIDNMRLQKALSLLQENHLTVLEISRRCGFNSPGYMAKFFQKRMGAPPSKFRKMN